MVNGVACGPCDYGYTCNTAQYCVEITNDNVVLQGDEDFVQEPFDEDHFVPDIDTIDPDCPPLISAPFPYHNEDGTIHFCRKCDTPTEKDPQCVANLWKEQNLKLATDYPEADCYPYPCPMPNLKPMTKMETDVLYDTFSIHECDLSLTPRGWYGYHRGMQQWNMSNGKIGYHLTWGGAPATKYTTIDRYVEYDIETKSYLIVAPSDAMLNYRGGFFLGLSADFRTLEWVGDRRYVGYYGSDGTFRIPYPKIIDFLAWEPVNNDRWVFANIQELQENFFHPLPNCMRYAKVGEWQWRVLQVGVGYTPDISGDLLGVDDDEQAYVCDLSRLPTSFKDCKTVGRGEEVARLVVFDRDGSNSFVYQSNTAHAIVKVTMNEGGWEYEDLVTDFSADNNAFPWALSPMQYRGNVLLYLEITGDEGRSSRACFYRIDTKKRYCLKRMEKDPITVDNYYIYMYGMSEFEEKWLLYQRFAQNVLVLRDMDCYCEKEGICPFE